MPSSILSFLSSISASLFVNYVCLISLVIITFFLAFSRNSLHSVVALSIFSLLMALIYLTINAPDVAMTEAAVGAGLSAIFMYHVLSITGTNARMAKVPLYLSVCYAALFFVLLLVLGYTVMLLPDFGSLNSVNNGNVANYYIENTEKIMDFPNFVTAILANFRGYDTLGETTVIMSASMCVWMILKFPFKLDEQENN